MTDVIGVSSRLQLTGEDGGVLFSAAMQLPSAPLDKVAAFAEAFHRLRGKPAGKTLLLTRFEVTNV